MESNVDTSAINVSVVENVPPMVSGVATGVVGGHIVPPLVPGDVSQGLTVPPLVPGVTLPAFVPDAVVSGVARSSGVGPGVAASGGGGSGVVPPAFATTLTLPPQPPNVLVM
ncbi:hypothetical protein LIER_16429 [Lithospermum erythrorhizon]|uniref:Uncharacterized protein n=1 Tax=Lithospermum erythrorhizon TaxID=34254 RepID=A0AAV3Q8I7_LITER